MDPRQTIKDRFENASAGINPVAVPSIDQVPVEYVNEGRTQGLRQCLHYIDTHSGISYLGMGRKGKIVYKFMRFIVDVIVSQQNSLDSNIAVSMRELYRLNRERVALHNRVNELEARLVALESEL